MKIINYIKSTILGRLIASLVLWVVSLVILNYVEYPFWITFIFLAYPTYILLTAMIYVFIIRVFFKKLTKKIENDEVKLWY